ncbi:uncharacterized protein LOC121368907 [Gigantopelta aegis]|uniref:uncharacterized protein LOC121368907 n=1 Tax=Gigantopelta aegis TaxID=1735272 RepID=UPI001B88B40F|nr:uncharacterized protein LOC121368907 [Gigantopelta aegis]
MFLSKDQILEQCPCTVSISDDIAVVGKNTEEHDKNLKTLMEKAREHGLVFNPGKCKIRTKIIKLYGIVVGAEGVHPDPNKVKDKKRNKTASRPQLHEFLGMATYMSLFIQNVKQHSAPLEELIKKGLQPNQRYYMQENYAHLF